VPLPQKDALPMPRTSAGPFSLKEPAMEENQLPKKPMNKTEIFAALGETTGLTKQQVGSLFDELSKLIGKNLGQDGPGTFAIPGLLQIKVVRKPATEERQGINPFTKEAMLIKAKPAKNVVKVVALKGLKDLV
jgi:nucleoid DNA-binding protein